MSQPENPQIGMALIPETPLDMSMLNINTNNWGLNNMAYNYQHPQVYAVLELPEGPSAPIDTAALSGKGFSSFFAEDSSPVDGVKPDFPVIERPSEPASAVSIEVEDEDDDPEFDLYRSSPAPAVSASVVTLEEHEPLFGDASPEKVFAHFELFISDEADSQRLMERFERMCAAMEPAFQRIQTLTSHLDT
jgi:hypothetical protein